LQYISTRGEAPALNFEGALMAGLAHDGGLYVPETWPSFSTAEIAGLAGHSYVKAAAKIMQPFVADTLAPNELTTLLAEAYGGFNHPAITPLVQLDTNLWLLELFHGPTLAFKDLAMQVLGLLMDRSLQRSGQRATILAATSGDTGAAAIEAFKNREAIDLFVLFPDGRVSPAQRRQMTTAFAPNVFPVAVRGTFDDCQGIVKTLFGDAAFRDRTRLSAVNSINWARIMAQMAYYFTAACALGAPNHRIRFTVPTGNFGDIFAGYAAMHTGLDIERLVIATNSNDILARTLATGRYEPHGVVQTASPSMDIQVSSNFERLIFEVCERNSTRVRTLMTDFARDALFTLSKTELMTIKHVFSAHRVDEAETADTIAHIYRSTGYMADPHTAVGLSAAAKEPDDTTSPMVVLSTAHPAKFPTAMEKSLGRSPEVPEQLQKALFGEEHFAALDANTDAVRTYISEHARITRGSEL
jgi:threonine synthase